jgi:hydroxymethylbilane synthase
VIRIGTRGSALARAQAEHVTTRLAALGHDAEPVVIQTTGDRVLDRPLAYVGGKGAFLKEIEEALLASEIDLAVHSLKDVPTVVPRGLALCAFLERADPRDALLSASGLGLEQLPAGARVGTSSLRRRAQILALRPDLAVVELRGNVDTRLRKLGEGQCDALVLAMAGLLRLGRQDEVVEPLDPAVLLPAPGQGVIALECRVDDAELWAQVAPLHHAPSARAAAAERGFLAALGGDCNVPLAAFAEGQYEGLWLRGLVASADGARILRAEAAGNEPEALGRRVADDLLSRGAGALLKPA